MFRSRFSESVERLVALYYRVTAFGQAHGPWRATKKRAERDAVEAGLGSYDERGRCYLDAGADLEWMHEWEWAKTYGAHPASCTRTHGQGSSQARRQA